MENPALKSLFRSTLLSLGILVFLLLLSSVVLAATGGTAGGSSGSAAGGSEPVSQYLQNLYYWFLAFVGISALFAIVLGGIMYMLAGANITKTDQARGWITRAIWGIVLAATSVLLLRTINPDLTRGFDFEKIINKCITNKVC